MDWLLPSRRIAVVLLCGPAAFTVVYAIVAASEQEWPVDGGITELMPVVIFGGFTTLMAAILSNGNRVRGTVLGAIGGIVGFTLGGMAAAGDGPWAALVFIALMVWSPIALAVGAILGGLAAWTWGQDPDVGPGNSEQVEA